MGVRMATMSSRRWTRWRFSAASVGIAAFFMMAAFLFGTVGSPGEGVSSELRKYFIQFFLVTALGALVGIVVYEYRNRREASARERQRAIDSLASLLRQLDAIYRSVKKTRRLLRLSQPRGPSKPAYDEAVLKLDEDQQDLEQLARDVEVLEGHGRAIEPTRAARLAATRGAIWSVTLALSGRSVRTSQLCRIASSRARTLQRSTRTWRGSPPARATFTSSTESTTMPDAT
jgi:hypothetical protein